MDIPLGTKGQGTQFELLLAKHFPIARLDVERRVAIAIVVDTARPSFEPVWLVDLEWSDDRPSRQYGRVQIDFGGKHS